MSCNIDLIGSSAIASEPLIWAKGGHGEGAAEAPQSEADPQYPSSREDVTETKIPLN